MWAFTVLNTLMEMRREALLRTGETMGSRAAAEEERAVCLLVGALDEHLIANILNYNIPQRSLKMLFFSGI